MLWVSTLAVRATNRYVSLNGAHTEPYTNWVGAATGIQYAISACVSGDVVWVSNGIYNIGGDTNQMGTPDNLGTTNRVSITTEYVTVRSLNNDPVNTIIVGGGTYNTSNAIRCVYMTNNTTLIGFTLTNGATRGTGVGANVLSQSTNTVISNCVMVAGKAGYNGGGAYYGTLYNCTITNNLGGSYAGGAQAAVLYNCSIINNTGGNGCGGVRNSTAYNCLLKDNYGGIVGAGGALDSTLYNCVIVSNFSASAGGGIMGGAIYNCTVISNAATTSGGGVTNAGVYNSIVYFNTAPSGSNWVNLTWATNSCIAPNPGGVGNITGDPMFVNKGAGNYRLAVNSPCINTGTNYAWMLDPVDTRSKDMDRLARIRYGTVDMGAYERVFDATIYRLFR